MKTQALTSKYVKVAFCLLVALISLFALTRFFTSTTFCTPFISYLEEQKNSVAQLTAAATSSSVIVSALPGDTAQPIAEQLVKISSCFIVVLCALFLEKYLLTITAYLAFGLLIPIACGLYAAFFGTGKRVLMQVASRILAFALLLFAVIPSSVGISQMIDRTYETSVTAAIQSASELESSSAEVEQEAQEQATSKPNLLETIKDKVTETATSVTEGTKQTIAKAETMLNQYIESLAVMIVTSCAIPILVMLFFAWVIRLVLEGCGCHH